MNCPPRTLPMSLMLSAAVLVLPACVDRGYVQREWALNMRELAIQPVFPPREDIVVGDLFLFPLDPDSVEARRIFESKSWELNEKDRQTRDSMGMWTRWGTLPLNAAAFSEYKERISFAATGDALKGVLEDVAQGEALDLTNQPNTGDVPVFGPYGNDEVSKSRVNRGRLVAFPDFSATTYTEADFRALIPIEAFNLGLNASYSDFQSVTVRIPAAESYAVSVGDVLTSLMDANGNVIAAELTNLRPFSDLLSGPQFVRVITEVFYARAIDISVVSKSSVGVAAKLSVIEAAADAGGNANANPNQNNAAAQGNVSSDATAADLVKDTNERLNEEQRVPGGAVRLVSASDRVIGMRRLFDRPVAIGYRGVTLQLEVSNGVIRVVSANPSIGPVPALAKPASR